jgi:hypothetical protein
MRQIQGTDHTSFSSSVMLSELETTISVSDTEKERKYKKRKKETKYEDANKRRNLGEKKQIII